MAEHCSKDRKPNAEGQHRSRNGFFDGRDAISQPAHSLFGYRRRDHPATQPTGAKYTTLRDRYSMLPEWRRVACHPSCWRYCDSWSVRIDHARSIAMFRLTYPMTRTAVLLQYTIAPFPHHRSLPSRARVERAANGTVCIASRHSASSSSQSAMRSNDDQEEAESSGSR